MLLAGRVTSESAARSWDAPGARAGVLASVKARRCRWALRERGLLAAGPSLS